MNIDLTIIFDCYYQGCIYLVIIMRY